MNKLISSAFAAFLAITSIAANANTHIAAAENTAQVTALSSSTDMAVSTTVIMRIKVQLPDGSITFKKGRFDSLSKALVAYHQFIATLPYGSSIIAVDFTGETGDVIFAYQG